MSTSLPLRKAKRGRPQSRSVIIKSSLPHPEAQARIGVQLEFTTLVCPADAKEARRQVQRAISREGESLVEFGRPKTRRAGECISISDEFDTSGRAAGRYTYRIRWDRGPDRPALEAEAVFELTVVGAARPRRERRLN